MSFSEAWKKMNRFKLNGEVKKIDLLFLRWEIFGYRNNVGVLARFFQAALIATIAYLFCYFIGKIICLGGTSLIAIWGAVFAFIALLEVGSYYQKWRYLADLFNDVIKIDPEVFWKRGKRNYSKREHLAACLASDIIRMEMWNHSSFFPFLKITLEKAVFVKSEFNESLFIQNLNNFLYDQSLDQIKEYIKFYIEWHCSHEDSIIALRP